MEEEEITKEIKNINEIELEPIQEEEEEKTASTEPPVEEEKKNPPKNKKKIWMIVGIVGGILFLIILLLILFLPRNKKNDSSNQVSKSKDSKFVSVLKESLKSGEFDKAIQEGLRENGVEVDSVCILRMDLDSDGDYGLVVYVDGNKKILLQLDTEITVSYEDSFPLDAKDSLGYAYSSEKDENYWYTESEKNYTIISSAKKIIKEEDFLNTYFSLTKTYKEKPILNHCIAYKFDKQLDAKTIEKNTIKVKDLLKDNNIKQEEIKEAYHKYLTEKTEKEQKEKEEAEKQAQEEELQKKTSGTFTLGNRSFKYGAYKILTAEQEEEGIMNLYADGTCTYKDASCKYQLGEVRNEEDELVPGITLNNGKTFIASPEGELLEPKEKISARYNG
ncbi:MAG: hypothetical protein IKF71_01075 [Bacilli bacterium]|nr:hypothetical protein [Bacilli bacterium]